jgi:thymidylate kinase
VNRPGIHPRVRAAFEALDGAGAGWALLRGLDDLASPDGDVDVLVDPCAAGLDAILARAGFARLPALGHGSHRFYVAYDPDEDAWLTIDVVTDVAFGRLHEFRTDLARPLVARRQRLGSVAALRPEDAFWHLLLHDVLGARDVAARRRDELRSLLPGAAAASPLRAFVTSLRPNLADRLVAAVADGEWDAVRRHGRDLRQAWRRRHPAVPMRSALQAIERRLPAAGSGPSGVSIAILGPDGAGKTTLAEALRTSIPIPARYIYLGIWRQTPFEERLRRVVGARLALRLVTLLSKSVLIRYHRSRGRVILLDRYTCDADLPAADVDWKGRVSARLVRRTCAEPDLVILLDAPVELMYARKGEHGIRELQLRRDAYLAMAGRFRQMVILDATEPLDDVRRRATVLLWDAWSRASPRGRR